MTIDLTENELEQIKRWYRYMAGASATDGDDAQFDLLDKLGIEALDSDLYIHGRKAWQQALK